MGEDGGNIEELSFDHVVVPDVGYSCGKGLSGKDIDAPCLLLFFLLLAVSLLDLQEGLLRIVSRVLSKSAGDDEEGITEALYSQLDLSLDILFGILFETLSSGNLESTTTGNDRLIVDSVLDSAESISNGILGLGNGVVVGSLDEDGAGEWVLDALNEGVFVVTESLLVDLLGPSEVALLNVVDGVELLSTAGEGDTFSVSLLATPNSDDTVTGEEFEGRGVNSLLVDDDEVFVVVLAQFPFELNDLHDLVIGELTLTGNELLALVGVGPEEAGVDLGLLVFEGDVEAHDVAVLEERGHVGVATTVVEHESLDEAGLGGHLVLHVHDLDHVEIEGDTGLLDGLHGVDEHLTEGVGELGRDLGVEGSGSDLEEELTGDLLVDLEALEELQDLSLSELDTVNDSAGVHSFSEVTFGLAHKFTDEEHVGGGSISSDVVLGGGRAANHSGSRVLDLLHN